MGAKPAIPEMTDNLHVTMHNTVVRLSRPTYGAEEGVALGFSQYLAETGQGLGIKLARRTAENAKLTNFAVIQALPRIADADPQTGLLMESLIDAIAQNSDEAKRRLADFLEKRSAKITHR